MYVVSFCYISFFLSSPGIFRRRERQCSSGNAYVARITSILWEADLYGKPERNMRTFPKLSVSPATINFGTVSNWVTFTVKYAAIRNTGTTDLVIASVAMSGDSAFAITNNPSGTIAKGGSCKVSLAFTCNGRLRSRFLNYLLQ
jgi:hypothetical protein